MDVKDRLASAEQQSHELHRAFSHLDHRIREFTEAQHALIELKAVMESLRAHLDGLRSEITMLQRVLPTVARKEDLDKLSRKLDTTPYEFFARSQRKHAKDEDLV